MQKNQAFILDIYKMYIMIIFTYSGAQEIWNNSVNGTIHGYFYFAQNVLLLVAKYTKETPPLFG